MCWIRAGWFITLSHASCWPTMISRNVTAQCDPEHRLVNHNQERVLRLSRRFSGGGSVIHANRRVIGDAAVCYCQIRLSENDRVEVFGMKNLFAAIVVFVGLTGLAAAQTPVAVVEDVQGKVTGVEFMDYVAPGKVIKLGQGGVVVLGYMKSCWRETITGIGTVIVGAEESMVHLGEVKGGKVQCDVSQSEPITREIGESDATVVRS